MKLVSVRIQNYKSITDSGDVPIADVTALVGKNESGKTAFLQALHLLNPLNPIKGKASFNDVTDYPSKAFSTYKKTRGENPAVVTTATFELTDAEVAHVASIFGPDALKSTVLTVSRGYGGVKRYGVQTDGKAALAHVVGELGLTEAELAVVGTPKTGEELLAALGQLPEPREATVALIARITAWRKHDLVLHLIDEVLSPALPKFFYFDDYSIMPGRVSLEHIDAKRAAATLEESEKTFLSLLGAVDADLGDFAGADFEELTRQLEAAANGITDQVFEFWSQNKDLRVNIQMSPANPNDEAPLNSGHIFNVRIYNSRHSVTVPFDERSRGFVWFFSFFAYFGNLPITETADVILLLDEPGVSLHAKAQGDFLHFIESKLAPERQVIYTTHSPFLIDPKRLDRVRTVEDAEGVGTVVSADVLGTDADTVFPLQAALGYELAQTLFLGPNTLLVEGPSDLIYLQLLSQASEELGLGGLDSRWVVTPVGGATNLTTFISLIGANQLNVVVLMDASSGDQQKIRNLQASGHLRAKSLLQISEFTGNKDSDIEDLLPLDYYLELVNGAYSINPPLTAGELKNKSPRAVIRVEKAFEEKAIADGHLNHLRPATFLLKEQVSMLSKLSESDLLPVVEMFKRINALVQ
ncbi:MAG: hypothetical protein C0444_07545 [Microbacterium sp.]|nr:hypothetical protein [Microbacterium sp.]MBA4346119.1 hypothetical protein [Microbacterium sp.]